VTSEGVSQLLDLQLDFFEVFLADDRRKGLVKVPLLGVLNLDSQVKQCDLREEEMEAVKFTLVVLSVRQVTLVGKELAVESR